jgi:hypothetical protein
MQSGSLNVVDGVSVGAWIKPRLSGGAGAVTCEVPSGFAAYARIFHPAIGQDGSRVRWAEVAKARGTVAHREMQWHALLGFSSPKELGVSYGPGCAIGRAGIRGDPPTGQMDVKDLDALCEVLGCTADGRHCYFGLCTIQGWRASFAPEELKPLLRLPWGRDYIVLAGSLSAVDEIFRDWSNANSGHRKLVARKGHGRSPSRARPDGRVREAPNLIWPADHTWYLASEVDFDSTLVGGSADLIKAIVDSPDLEAWQVEPTDSLAWDADKINGSQADGPPAS